MPIMIWAAAIIEAGIQNFIDMGILLLIQVGCDTAISILIAAHLIILQQISVRQCDDWVLRNRQGRRCCCRPEGIVKTRCNCEARWCVEKY